MPITDLPAHIQTALRAERIIDLASLDAAMWDVEPLLIGPIFSQDAFKFLNSYAQDRENIPDDLKHFGEYIAADLEYEFVALSEASDTWSYKQISEGASNIGYAITISNNLASPQATLIESLIIALWFRDANFWQNREDFINKNAVAIWNRSHAQRNSEAIRKTFLNLSFPNIVGRTETYSPSWQTKDSFLLASTSKLISAENSVRLGRIVASCFQAQAPRWRFISFYRVFENGLVLNLLDKLNASFLNDPDESLDEVKAALGKEQLKLHEVMVANNLENILTELYNHALAFNNKNRYATALFKVSEKEVGKIQEENTTYMQQIKANTRVREPLNAVCLIYKMRCSIVHAGEGRFKNPPIENFDDADDFVEEVLPFMERALFAYAQLTFPAA